MKGSANRFPRITTAALLAACVMAPARAGMITTPELLATPSEVQRASVDTFLAREEVQRLLVERGVDPADAAERVASLTQDELRMLSSRIDSLPAGAGLSTLELILIIILIVLLI